MIDQEDEQGLDPDEMEWIYNEHIIQRNRHLLDWIDKHLKINPTLSQKQFHRMIDVINDTFKKELLKDGIIYTGVSEDVQDRSG